MATPLLTATPTLPPTYNVGMAETFSWIPIEGAGRPIFARATYLANPEDIKISLSAGDINVNLDDINLNTDELEEIGITTNENLSAIINNLNKEFDETQTLLDALTALQTEKQNYLITLLDKLTSQTEEIDFNTDNIENLLTESNTNLSAIQTDINVEFGKNQTLLNSLTALQEAKQDSIITLLHQLTANTDELEINTNDLETLINSLTSITQSEFDRTQTFLDSLTAIDYSTSANQGLIITLLDSLTSNTNDIESLLQTSNTLLDAISGKELTISLDVSAINLNTDGIEDLITGSNTRLDALTAVDYSTAARQDSVITLINDLTASSDSIESLIAVSNTRLDALTAIDYSTEAKQDSIITLLHQLTANTETIDIDTTDIETRLDLLTAVNFSTEAKQDSQITLLNSLTALQELKQDSIITLLNELTAKETTISLDVSAINLNTDGIEGLITNSNTRLDALTAVDYSTEAKQDSIITLLDSLTAKVTVTDVTNIETRLDALTAVDYSTEAKQDSIITLLDALTAKQTTINLDVSAINLNTDGIEGLIGSSNTLLNSLTAIQDDKQTQIITLLHAITGSAFDVDLNTDQLELNVDQVETLLQDLTASNKYVPGWSIPPYDEISFEYVGSTDIFRKVSYLNNSTQVMALSFTYVTEPPTTGNDIIQTVKKI